MARRQLVHAHDGGVVEHRAQHAALRIGDSLVTLCDAMPAHGFVAPSGDAWPTFITLYIEDADAMNARALR